MMVSAGNSLRLLLKFAEFFNSADVAAFAEGGGEENFHDLANLLLAEQIGAHA